MNFTAFGPFCLFKQPPSNLNRHTLLLSLSLSLSHYLTQRLEMNFTARALFFSPQHHPIVTRLHCSYCLSPLQP